MPELRVVWRMATWWQCAILLAFTALFGWIVGTGLRSTSPEVWGHVLVPAYGLWLYATLAALVNRRSVVVTREHLLKTNGPVPLGSGRERITRDEVACSYYTTVHTVGDGGETVVLWYVTGIRTRAGHDVPVFGTHPDHGSAQAAARRIADAFGAPSDGLAIPARQVGRQGHDPADRRRVLLWVGLTVAALVAGVVWELVYRSRR